MTALNPEQIAVIIIGRNEGERLEEAFLSVKKMNVKMIYVDSASTDGSIDIAKAHQVPFIELTQDRPLNAARSRNAGFDWVLENYPDIQFIHLLDGDCTLDPNWLSAAISELNENENIAAVTGRLREKEYEKSIYARLCDMGWYIRPGEIFTAGGVATIKAFIFNEIGGFNDSLIAGEELEFYSRIREKGYKLRCLEQEIGKHDSNISSYHEWWTRTVRTGFSYASAAKWKKQKKERVSLIFWGGILPLMIVTSFFFSTLLGGLFILLYPIQVIRTFMKLRTPYNAASRFLFAFFCVLDKFPAFLGFLKYHYAKMTGRKQQIIEYKN